MWLVSWYLDADDALQLSVGDGLAVLQGLQPLGQTAQLRNVQLAAVQL